jgi:hypothetical protein
MSFPTFVDDSLKKNSPKVFYKQEQSDDRLLRALENVGIFSRKK